MDPITFDWEAAWRTTLAGLPTRIWCTDLDDTFWQDILVHLNEQFGPMNTATGQKKWRDYDRAYKLDGTMTNGEHLIAEYQDLFASHTLEELVAWVKTNIQLVPGTPDFVRTLHSLGIGVVAISNGARQIAQPKLEHHGLDIRLMSNWFEGTTLKFVHDENVGIDKGVLVRKAAEWGYEIVGFSGDAKGDIEGARATAHLGGLVLACGQHGLYEWCKGNLMPEQWKGYTDFHQVLAMSEVQAAVAGN